MSILEIGNIHKLERPELESCYNFFVPWEIKNKY